MNKFKITSKLVILTVLSFFINACSFNTEVISSSYTTAFTLLTDKLIVRDDTSIDYALIDKIPYASLLFNFGNSSKSLLILETINSERSRWVSADNKAITIEQGRIIETLGFPNDIEKVERFSLSFKEVISTNEVFETFAYYTFRKPQLRDLKVQVQTRSLGMSDIEVAGKVKSLYLIEEIISSKKINWTKKNRYWVDPIDYFVWKSEQEISPRLPRIYITITKKPAI